MKTSNTAPTFGIGTGVVNDTIQYMGVDYSLIIQSDGKILLHTSDGAVTRYNKNGERDVFFGENGRIQSMIIGVDGDSSDNTIGLQADGKILVAGSMSSGGFAVSRFNLDGSLDDTFGINGSVITTSDINGRYTFYRITSIAIQGDGRFLVTGEASDGNLSTIVLLKYGANGVLDTTFGDAGLVSTQVSRVDVAKSIAIQNDGKILVAASSRTFTGYEWVITRYTADGKPDLAFGNEGIVRTRFGNVSEPDSIKVQDDGKIVVLGSSNERFAMARYNQNGSIDISFDSNEKSLGDPDTWPSFSSSPRVDFQMQSDGKILVGGSSYHNFRYHFTVGRFNEDGTVDMDFGSNGINFIESINSDQYVGGIALQSDGKVLAVGMGPKGDTSAPTAILARFDKNGNLDKNFNVVSSLSGEVVFIENGFPVIIDEDVQIFDEELTISDSYAGASLTLSRINSPDSNDQFSGSGIIPGQLSGSVTVFGAVIGTYFYNNGVIKIDFNSAATQASVNLAMQSLAYQNINDSPPDSIQIVWTFNDGNAGAQGIGGNLTTVGSSTVKIVPVNDHPVGGVTISGHAVQGRSLTPTISFTDPDGIPVQNISYTWFAQGSNIPVGYSSNGSSGAYVPTEADVGKALRVVASYVDGGGTQEQIVSEYTQIISSNNPNFYVSKIIDPEGLYLTEGKTYVVGSIGLSVGDYVTESITLFQGSKPFFSKPTPSELLRNQDGSFGLLFGSGISWAQQKFDQDGIAIGKALKLSFPAFLSLESQFGKDINEDGSIGDTVAQNLAQGNGVGLYKTTSGSLVIDAIELDPGDALGNPLTLSVGTKLFAPKVHPSGLILYQDGSLGVLSGAGSAWTEQMFGSNGKAIGKAVKLTITDVLAKESMLQVDLNADDKLGDTVKAVLDNDGYANNAPLLALYSTDSGGYALDADGLNDGQSFTELFTFLKAGTKPWAVKAGAEILGIAERSNGDIEVLLKTGTALSAQRFDVDTGLAIGKAVKLKAGSDQITAREPYYELNLDSLPEISLVGLDTPPTGW